MTFAEAVTSVFGYRGAYEQPRYVVVQPIGPDAEIRLYEPRTSVEVSVTGADRDAAASDAFRLLFRYITGANQGSQMIAMTTPVRTNQVPTDPALIAMTSPVQTSGEGNAVTMRFYLPQDVAARGAPAPTDPRVHIVDVPQSTLAVLRYSGVASTESHNRYAQQLLDLLKSTDWTPHGAVFRLNYDPPFTIPLFRRNEAAVAVTR